MVSNCPGLNGNSMGNHKFVISCTGKILVFSFILFIASKSWGFALQSASECIKEHHLYKYLLRKYACPKKRHFGPKKSWNFVGTMLIALIYLFFVIACILLKLKVNYAIKLLCTQTHHACIFSIL